MTGSEPSLTGHGVIVTRPVHQAAPLADRIRRAGGHAILFPVIEIADVEDARPVNALIDRLDEFELAIFISPNAVGKALTMIKARRALPARLAFAAVGRGSVLELKKFGVTDVAAPSRFDSESLLALPALQNVAGRRVIIFRGQGGRELLGEALTARGAIIEYAECYRRVQPAADPAPLMAAWERREIHAVTVTSSEGLGNFCAMVGAHGLPWLQKTPLFAPHVRIADAARKLEFSVVVQTGQGDDGLMRGLQQWFAAHG